MGSARTLLTTGVLALVLAVASCGTDARPAADDGRPSTADDSVQSDVAEEDQAPLEDFPSEGDAVAEDDDRAAVLAAAVAQVLTVDNTFRGRDVFDDIRIAEVVGSDSQQPLQPLELELIAAGLSDLGFVTFVPDADAIIDDLFEQSPRGVAIVSVEAVRMADDRAEVEMRMWCGSLCGTFLTYEAVPRGGGWEITRTVGPIAVS